VQEVLHFLPPYCPPRRLWPPWLGRRKRPSRETYIMSARKVISTDREILGLQPDQTGRYEVGIKGAKGLTLRVYPSAEKIFEVRYVAANGARRRMKLGGYRLCG